MRSNVFFRVGLLSFLVLVAANQAEERSNSTTLAKGTRDSNVSIEEVPYQVLLELPNSKFCGGCILSGQWVITTAQCTFHSPNLITVRAGTSKKSSGGSVHRVQSIIRHENHTIDEHNVPINDVALLRMTTRFNLDRTRMPIQIWKEGEQPATGSNAVVSGWGQGSAFESSNENLRKRDVSIMSKSDCDKAYLLSHGGLPSGQICINELGKYLDICDGDTGGPLTINGRLAGLMSWNQRCDKDDLPEVCTDIAYYSDWIMEKTGIKF